MKCIKKINIPGARDVSRLEPPQAPATTAYVDPTLAFVSLRWPYVGLREPTLALRWPSLAFVSGGERTLVDLHELSWVGRRWPMLAIATAAAVAVTGAGAR